MEIQYAIFCERVKFPDSPQGAIVLTRPLSVIELSDFGGFGFPLFVVFLGGQAGKKYKLQVKVLDVSGEVIATRNHDFTWLTDSLSQAECAVVAFPFNTAGYHTFILSVDGEELHRVRVPINKISS